MVDLTIVGAGYWGAAIAIEAMKKGWLIKILDEGDMKSGTRNASAICDPSCYQSSIFKKLIPKDWCDSEIQESINWLLQQGGVYTQERFKNKFQGTKARLGNENIYLPHSMMLTDKIKHLVNYTRLLSATKIKKGWKVSTLNDIWDTKRLVIACGYSTDLVLNKCGIKPIGVTKLAGRGIIAKGIPKEVLPVSVMIRPYCKHTVRNWFNYFKIGDTAEKQLVDKHLENLRTIGRDVLDNYQEINIQLGYRPVLDKFTVESIAGLIVATGGHRVGLGVAGLVAKKTLEALR